MSSKQTDPKPANKSPVKHAVVFRRLAQHIGNSKFAEKLGLHSLIGKMTVDHLLTLNVSGPVDSYLASVLAEAIRRELLDEGKTFTFETVMSSRDKLIS